MLILTFIAFFVGLFLGSFLFVVADRVSRGVSFVTGRSKCNSCNHVLSWYELIPVVSFFLQRGRCRHCKIHLSFWYPLSELLTGLVVALIFFTTFPLGLTVFILYEIISLCLLTICFADIRYEIIPLLLIVIVGVAALFLTYSIAPGELANHIFSGLGAGLFFLIIFLITKGKGMGFGDVLYVISMGILLGFPGIFYGLYLSFVVGAIISLVLVVMKKKKLHGGTIPFGPFLVLGTFIMMIGGREIIQIASNYVR
jgi:leader peptidase (prepilin peptidase)/N-methyltransferase